MNRNLVTARAFAQGNPLPAIILLGLLLAALPMAGRAEEASDSSAPVRQLSLEQARTLALASDQQLAQMEQAVLGAEANVMAARADALPQVDIGGTWARNLKKPSFFLPPDLAEGFGGATAVEMGGDWDLQAAATLTLNLWTAGRLSAAKGMATEALQSTRWQEVLVADAVIYNAETAYFNVLLAEADLEIAEGAMALARENLRVTSEIYEQGNTSKYDLLRAQVELANRETPLTKAQNDVLLTTLRLRRVCGLDSRTKLELTGELGGVSEPDSLPDLLAEMHKSSPELRALEHAVQAAEMSVKLAKAGRGPVVQLQGQYALQGQWDDDYFPGSDETATSAYAALAVVMPIFDGFAAKSDIQGNQADLRMASLELERVTLDRELGVNQSRTYLENALIALKGRHDGVDLAEETYRLAAVRMENGLATPLERLDAELALTEAQGQLAGALYACNVAASTLKLAVGGSIPITSFAEENER